MALDTMLWRTLNALEYNAQCASVIRFSEGLCTREEEYREMSLPHEHEGREIEGREMTLPLCHMRIRTGRCACHMSMGAGK